MLSVDVDHTHAHEKCRQHEQIELLTCSSTNYSVVVPRIEQLRQEYPGPVFAVLDSAHSKEHVLKELELLAPLLRRGDYVIVEDSDINGHPVMPSFGPGPWEAARAFMAKRPGFFTLDEERAAKFGWTAATDGFLRVLAGG